MNCNEFHVRASEFSRGELEDLTRTALLAHAESCAACSNLIGAQHLLSEDFVALANEQEDQSASAALERTLIATFRAKQARVLRSRPMFTLRWIPAVAAVLLCLAGAYALTRYARRPSAIATTQPEAKTSTVASSAPTIATPVPHKAGLTPRPPRRRNQIPINVQVVSEFYVVPYAEPLRPDEGKRIVRVRVPQSTFVTFGLPVSQDRVHDAVDADILVGEDNLPRAIRLVGEWQSVPRGSPSGARVVNANFPSK